MTTNNAFTEVIENLHFSLDHKMKTATLLPKMNEHYSGDIILPEKVKDNNGVEYSVIALEDSCFENCNGLTSIDIPSSVTSLGDHCFRFCSGLTSIELPSSITSLGSCCFADCSGLTSIEIPSFVSSLSRMCFEDCSSLTSIKIPSSVTSLGEYCFSGCSSLTSIIIPSSVTSLGENCFMCSFNLKSIYFKGMDPKYLSEAFIPTTCRIYVLDEYLVDYKYALGTDYMYIYTWNPKE